MNAITELTELALCFGDWRTGKLKYSKQVIAVRDFADASDKWQQIRSYYGWRASEVPVVVVIDVQTGESIAKVSYNGRVWGIDGKEIRIGERQISEEFWKEYNARCES